MPSNLNERVFQQSAPSQPCYKQALLTNHDNSSHHPSKMQNTTILQSLCFKHHGPASWTLLILAGTNTVCSNKGCAWVAGFQLRIGLRLQFRYWTAVTGKLKFLAESRKGSRGRMMNMTAEIKLLQPGLHSFGFCWLEFRTCYGSGARQQPLLIHLAVNKVLE